MMKKIELWKKRLQRRKKTFGAVADEWLEKKKRLKDVKESTFLMYTFQIQKHLKPKFGDVKLRRIKRYGIQEFIEELGQNLAPKTVRDIVTIFKAILKYANNEYKCEFKLEEIKGPKTKKGVTAVLQEKEKERIEKQCLHERNLKSLGIIICLYTGLRIGEICSLKWKDINLEKKEICVRKTIQRVYNIEESKTKVMITDPKTTNSVRNIPISDKLCRLLKPIAKKYKADDYLLSGDAKKYILPHTYRRYFQKILQKTKIKTNYRFHSLRHSFATFCMEVGMDIKSLSEILGHSNTKITLDLYVHSSYSQKKKFLEKL